VTRVFLDINVVVDAIELRDGFFEPAVRLCHASEQRVIEGYVSAHALTTLSYLVQQVQGPAGVRRAISQVLAMLEIVAVDRRLLTRALSVTAADYEDAVSLAAAERAGCELLVTRDTAGFATSPITVVDPQTAVQMLFGASPGQVSETGKPYAARRTARRRVGRPR
jgi:predicted nucleic acid-binding protein